MELAHRREEEAGGVVAAEAAAAVVVEVAVVMGEGELLSTLLRCFHFILFKMTNKSIYFQDHQEDHGDRWVELCTCLT